MTDNGKNNPIISPSEAAEEAEKRSSSNNGSSPKVDRRSMLKKNKSISTRVIGSCRTLGKSMKNVLTSMRNVVTPKSNRVSFDMIEVREHDLTLGDNPSCSHGPPVSMKWKHNNSFRMSLDDYETERGSRRAHHELVIPRYVREHLIKKDGVSRGEMNDVMLENTKIKEQNRNSASRFITKERFKHSVKKIVPSFIKRRNSNRV